MHVLVTGGSGYVGSVLCEELLKQGNEVTVLDVFNYGIGSLIHLMHRYDFHVVRGDIRDKEKLCSAIDCTDAVIHLAAMVGAPLCNKYPSEAYVTNVEGTRKVSECADGRPLLYASTGSIYGKVEHTCTEDTPTDPLSIYGKTKLEGEQIALDNGGVALRFATLFGVSPCMRFDLLLHDLIYQAIRNQCFVMYQGSVWRTFLHVKDAAMAYIHLLNAWSETTHNVFNIGSPSLNILKRDIADRVSLRFPMTVVQNEFAEDPDQRDYRVSYDRIMATGWQAYEDLDASIGRVGQLVQVDRVETKWRLHV